MFSLPLGYKELYEHTCLLPILGTIDDYNYYMRVAATLRGWQHCEEYHCGELLAAILAVCAEHYLQGSILAPYQRQH
jgi:hypothetical protein